MAGVNDGSSVVGAQPMQAHDRRRTAGDWLVAAIMLAATAATIALHDRIATITAGVSQRPSQGLPLGTPEDAPQDAGGSDQPAPTSRLSR